MKRGKEDEKAIGPMFPRLHVNDTEKKGPKAPPRNKMALYEQLSIPSQRFSHGSVNLEPPSSQGFKNERGMFSPYQLPTRPHSDKQYSQYSDLSSPMTQVEQRKKLEDNDFRVPIFVQPTPSQECGDYTSEKISTSNPYSNRPSKFRKAKNTSMLESITREGESHEGESSKEVTTDQLEVVSNSLTIETTNGLNKQSDSQRENIALLEKRNSSTSVRDFPSEGLSDDTESHYKSCRSPQTRDLEGVDSLSETSVMDSVSRVDVTPDDVVGIIGQKQFWKARRAIVNQQRVFAVQVFELHRLMKVQKSIAASPHLLLEDSAYLGKPTKNSSAIPLIYSIKAIPNVSKQKSDELEKPTHRKEGLAENIGRRESFSSVQNVVQRSSCRPMSGTSPVPSSISSNNNARPCCFNQPQGVHWLIPVMSPSEGLVYKPYPGPAFVSPAGVGGGSLGSKLLSDSSYPSPHPPYQLPAFPPAAPHAYFPPYSMPVMNAAAFSGSSVEQMNTAPSIPSQVSVPESNGSIRHENLPTAPNHKNQAFVDGLNDSLVSEDIEVRASTTTTSQLRDSRASCVVERRNVLPLFPTAPAIDTPNPSPRPWPPKPDRLQVIKVIPHNARSATESAAKIFQSIQEERKQYDKL